MFKKGRMIHFSQNFYVFQVFQQLRACCPECFSFGATLSLVLIKNWNQKKLVVMLLLGRYSMKSLHLTLTPNIYNNFLIRDLSQTYKYTFYYVQYIFYIERRSQQQIIENIVQYFYLWLVNYNSDSQKIDSQFLIPYQF